MDGGIGEKKNCFDCSTQESSGVCVLYNLCASPSLKTRVGSDGHTPHVLVTEMGNFDTVLILQLISR